MALLVLGGLPLLLSAAPAAAGPDPPFTTVAPVVNSFGIRRDAGGDLDCPSGDTVLTDDLVDPGTPSIFCIFADVTDADGWANLDYLEMRAYFDSGSESTTYNLTQGGNRNVLLNYTNTSTSQFRMDWPIYGEVTLQGGVDQIISATNHEVRWRITIARNFRWAPCTSSTAPRCLAGAPSINSWNATLSVRDATGNVVTSTMEFGAFKRTELSVSGNPSGVGYPGQPEFRLPTGTPQSVSFGSNAPYRLNVSICDLSSGSGFIPRQSLKVRGTQKLDLFTSTAFGSNGACPAPSSADLVLNATATCFNEFFNGTGTTGAAVDWFVQIPLGTLSGTYTSTIRYSLISSNSTNSPSPSNPCSANHQDGPRFLTRPLVTDLTSTAFRVSWVPDRPVTGLVQLSTSPTFASLLCTSTDAAPLLPSGGVLVLTSPGCGALTPGTTYYWRVRMTDSLGRYTVFPVNLVYPSNTTKTDPTGGSQNPTFTLRPYRDIDGSTTCNSVDDRQQYFLAYLNHSGAGTMASRGSTTAAGCGQPARVGWWIGLDSDNLRNNDATGAPHLISCVETTRFWVVGFNNTMLHQNYTSYTRSSGCPPSEPSIALDARTSVTATTGGPNFLRGPLATDLTLNAFRVSWVPDKPVYGTVHVSTTSTFSSFCFQMDPTTLLTSGGVMADTGPGCVLSSGTTYYWRAYMMDVQGRFRIYPGSGAYPSVMTKTNGDPGIGTNPTFNVAPYRDVDGSRSCNTPDDKQVYFLGYLNHSGAEPIVSRGVSGGGAATCGTGPRTGWIISLATANLRNSGAVGAPHDICPGGAGTGEIVSIWSIGFNNTLTHQNNTMYSWAACAPATVSILANSSTTSSVGGPMFVVGPVRSDLTTAAFSASWVANKRVQGTVQVSASATFATILCLQMDLEAYYSSGVALASTSPGCALASGTLYYWRAYMMDLQGRTAASAIASTTTKTDPSPGPGTNPTILVGAYRDIDGNNACGVLDRREARFLAFMNHSGAETMAARGSGSNAHCAQGALAGWFAGIDTNNLRDSGAAGGPHGLAAAEVLDFDVAGLVNGSFRQNLTLSYTWDGVAPAVTRFAKVTPTPFLLTEGGDTTDEIEEPQGTGSAAGPPSRSSSMGSQLVADVAARAPSRRVRH